VIPLEGQEIDMVDAFIGRCLLRRGCVIPKVTNADHFALPPDDLAAARRSYAGLEDKFFGTHHDIRRH